jgi:hypothetical protein
MRFGHMTDNIPTSIDNNMPKAKRQINKVLEMGDWLKKKNEWRSRSVGFHLEHAFDHLRTAKELSASGLAESDQTNKLVFEENLHHAATRMVMAVQQYHDV